MLFTRFRSPLQWYVSFPRTATRYAPVMVLFTAAWDDTCMNTVSSPLTLLQMPQQPHCRLLPDPLFHASACTCQACTTSTAYTCCTCNTCDSKDTDHSCSHHATCPRGHPCVYTCNTQCSPCAAQKIMSCSCCTQVPDTGEVTVLKPMRGDPWLRTSLDFVTYLMHT